MVDKVNGMPNFSAARAPSISPSAQLRPVSPTGAIATGIATSCPAIVLRVERWSTSIATRWRNCSASRSARLARSVASS